MLNIKNENIYAQPIEIAGVTYPAILSMKAVHDIEETLNEPFEAVYGNLYRVTQTDEGNGIAFEERYLSVMLLACLTAANKEIDIDELTENIRKDNGVNIGLQLIDVLTAHMPVNTAEYVKKNTASVAEESGIDWRSVIYFATAQLNWTLEQFWDSTFFMFGAMLEQHLIYNGIKKSKQERKVAKTYEEWLENVKEYKTQ